MNSINVRRINRVFSWLLPLFIAPLCSLVLSTATVVLAAPPSAPPPAPLAPRAVDGCPYLTQADASALLQEPVQAQAVGNLLFATAPITLPVNAGFCGYVSVASDHDQPPPTSAPHVATQVGADHAVVVAKLLMGQQIQLLPITDLLHTATGEVKGSAEDRILQALLWSGSVEGTIDYLYHLAQDQPRLHARHVGALGEIAVWLWLETDEGNFAVLVDGDGRDLNLIAALLGKEADEQSALDVATRLALQMEGRLPLSAPAPAENECEFLSHAAAMVMLNESLPKTADYGAGLCGYGGMAQTLAGDEAIQTDDLPYGIASGVLSGSAAQQLFQRMADSLHQENPAANDVAYTTLKTSLDTGEQKLNSYLLFSLADPQYWFWGRAEGDYTDWIVKLTANAEHIVFLTTLRPDGKVGFIIAHLKRERTVSGAFQQIEKNNPELINKSPRVPLRSTAEQTPTVTSTPTPVSTQLATPPTTATPAPVADWSIDNKDGRWTQILFSSDPITVTAAIMFNKHYYVGTANDGLRVVASDPRGGYEWVPLHAGPNGLASDHVTVLAIVENNLWVGTADAGISILNPYSNAWHTMNVRNSRLPSNMVHRIRPAKPGDRPFASGAWISTNSGALEWHQGEAGLSFKPYAVLRNPNVWDVDTMLNPVGYDLYAATDAGLLRNAGGAGPLVPTATGCTFDRVTQLVVSNTRAVWLMGETKSQHGNGWKSQGLCQLSAGFLYSHWQAYTVANGRLPSDDVTALRMDDTGRLWASFATNANSSGGVAFYDGAAWRPLAPPENGLIQTPITMVQSADRQLLLSHPHIDGLTIYTPVK